MKDKLTQGLKIAAFFGVGIVILYLVYQNQQAAYLEDCQLKGIPDKECSLMDKVIDDFRSSRFLYIWLALLLFLVSNVARALRWQILLKPLGHDVRFFNSFAATMIGYLINLSIPRAGELAKSASLSKSENIPLDETIGTIVTDRIADVICLLLAFGLTIIFASNDIWNYLEQHIDISSKFAIFTSNPLISSFMIFALIAMVWVTWAKRQILVNNPIISKIITFINGVIQGAMSVIRMEQKWLFIIYTIVIWACYYLMTYVAFDALTSTEHLSPVVGLVVFVFGSLGIVIPSPGGMGSYHFLVQESLALYSVSGIDAFSFANIVFFSIQALNVVVGLACLLLLPLYNRKLLQK